MIKKLFFISLVLIFSCNKNNQENIKKNFSFVNSYSADLKNGRKVFNKACITCHLYGTGGSIMLNDSLSWSRVISKKDKIEIYSNVYNGYMGEKGPMPYKGGCLDCSDEDLMDAIEYILSINGLSTSD
tara:strand:+ start:144 stop:527 length:384 start_codon:yes stop_codon:yes gene_type:complete